jgi:LysR family pca operon transcriptional activator
MLQISQPALSVAIARLEDVVGTQLVNRGRNGATLTQVGEVLIRHAESLETVLHTAQHEVKLFDGGVVGPLTVGGTPLATLSIIPDVIARLTEEFSNLNMRVVEDTDENLMERLLGHEIDLVISNIGLTPPRPEIEAEPLFYARAVAVVRARHPLAGRAILSIREIADLTWVLPHPGGAFRKQIEALFTTSGELFPVNVVEALPFSVLKEIVRRSDCVTVLSDQIVGPDLADGSLVAIPLKEKLTDRVFGLHRSRSRKLNTLGARFVELAKELAPEYEVPGAIPKHY